METLDPEYSLNAVGKIHDPIFSTNVSQTNSFISLVANLKKMRTNNEAMGVHSKPQIQPHVRPSMSPVS